MIPWLLLGGLGLGAVAFAAKKTRSTAVDTAPTDGGSSDTPSPSTEDSLAWADRVISRVSLHEGRYDSVNR